MVFIRPTVVRDTAILEAASHGKYQLLRTQQLLRSDKDLMLMPGAKRPVLEELNNTLTQPKTSGGSTEASTVNW